MRNKLNKHGPDIDIGVWYAALLRHNEAASCLSDESATVVMIPVKSITDRDSLNTWGQKRRRRSTIVCRRTGESPPGIVSNSISNNIDSFTRTSLPIKVKLESKGFKDIFGLLGGVCLLRSNE